jgi:hypothetical protein
MNVIRRTETGKGRQNLDQLPGPVRRYLARQWHGSLIKSGKRIPRCNLASLGEPAYRVTYSIRINLTGKPDKTLRLFHAEFLPVAVKYQVVTIG